MNELTEIDEKLDLIETFQYVKIWRKLIYFYLSLSSNILTDFITQSIVGTNH